MHRAIRHTEAERSSQMLADVELADDELRRALGSAKQEHPTKQELPTKRSYDSGPAMPSPAISYRGDAKPASYDSTMTEFEAEQAVQDALNCPVELALIKGAPRWQLLQDLLDSRRSRSSYSAAAERLIKNHAYVLRDLTNPHPISQLELVRVSQAAAEHADQALREVARRLLKKRTGAETIEEHLDTSDEQAVATWAATAKYLDSRIQSQPHERPGRAPDMNPNEATAMRQALQEIWWQAHQTARSFSTTHVPRRR
jgi:hypothetical protein